jgi:hypothetical protein
MLLDTQISSLITQKSSLYEDRLDVFDLELTRTGLVKTRNFMMIDILYHLLERGFTQDYLNRELYKRLNHLLNVTETISISNPAVSPVASIAAVTTSVNSIAFGNIEVGEESNVVGITITGTNVIQPITIVSVTAYRVSLYPVSNFSNGCVIIPKDGLINTTLFVKFVPLAAASYSSNITISSSEITTKLIACTGTGIVTP